MYRWAAPRVLPGGRRSVQGPRAERSEGCLARRRLDQRARRVAQQPGVGGSGLNAAVPIWTDLAAADLSPTQLHDVLRLRNLVFVVEQDCAYDDIDGLDLQPTTRHLLATTDGGLAACSRFLPEPDAIRV